MRVLLLNSCFVSQPRDRIQRWDPHPRLGVASIAAYLRSKGHDVEVLDPQVEGMTAEAAARSICSRQPDFLALPAHTEEINDAADIAALVKQTKPAIITIIGGYHLSALPEETLTEFESFDFGIAGEGEIPCNELVSGAPSEQIRGLVWRDGDAVRFNPQGTGFPSLDELPPPAWDLYRLDKYLGVLSIEAVRSCPFRCSFCFKATAPKSRYKSPARIVSEIEEYAARPAPATGSPWRFMLASSGSFPINREHGVACCEELIRRGLNVKWHTYTRVDLLDEELLRLMKRAGCTFINIGIESGDAEVLGHCSKGITLELAESVVKLCYKVGIDTELNFILGLPHETRASLENTRRFAKRLRLYSTLANFAILTPYPGTRVYEMAIKHEGGFKLNTRDWRLYTKHQGLALGHDDFSAKELRAYQTRMYLTYYLGSPRKTLRILRSPFAPEVIHWRRALALFKRTLIGG